jgi:ribosomal-protein-alanine N-acetyltransferase
MKSYKNRAPDPCGVIEVGLLRVRALLESDLGAVLAIEQASFPSPWSKTFFLRELSNPLSHCWVAVEPEIATPTGLAGYLCFWVVRDEMQIMNLATHPAWRRRGVARGLLSLSLGYAVKRGATRAVLEVRPSNHAALGLYRSMQFNKVGGRPGYYGDTGEDAIVMLRKLHPDHE